MKVEFVELSGFRGVRDQLRVDFSDGFVVLVGRNGAGKSTVIDAIDFVMTGTINRFAVKEAKGGGLSDHIWWMGDGTAEAHYVSVGFVEDDGTRFSVVRDRDRGLNMEVDNIVEKLCNTTTAPAPSMETLIQTSIVRDELITALSLDLPEQGRFKAVRYAIGATAGPDYSVRTGAVLAAAKVLKETQDEEVHRIQAELGRTLTALTEARSSADRSSDLTDALRIIEAIPDLTDMPDKTASIRKWLAEHRRSFAEVDGARTRAERLVPQIKEAASLLASDELTAAESALAAAVERRDDALRRLKVAEGLAVAQRETDEYAAHLSALVEHGAIVGLDHGHCPLCDAERTSEEFRTGLVKARDRLAGQGERLRTVAATVDEAKNTVAATEDAVISSTARVAELRNKHTAIDKEMSTVRQVFISHGFGTPVDNLQTVQQLLFDAQERVAQVERALFVLEASSAIDRMRTLEARVLALKEQSEKAAARLSDAEKAVEIARQIDAASRTVANQILEEQFGTVMPLLKELYRRLRPHPDWLEIEADFGGRVRASLNFVVSGGGNPQFLFSSGQRRAAGLAFLLAIHLSRTWCRWNTLVLDDPVQHIDDYRALNLAEVLASIRRTGRQVIVAVEDVALADVLCRRLRSSAGDSGRRIDLRISATGTTELANVFDIEPLPSHALRQAMAS